MLAAGVWIALILFSALLALTAWMLHKVRRIHLASYRIEHELSQIRGELFALYPQWQALQALERRLALNRALPPLRGWAGSPDFLLAVTAEMDRLQPQCVLECSSGASTLVIARCLQQQGSGHVYSLEHDPEFARQTRQLLQAHGLGSWGTVVDAPLVGEAPGSSPWYSLAALPEGLPPAALLVIDGPPGVSAPLARLPALDMLADRLAPAAVLLLDDADRPDEREIVARWLALYPEFSLTRLPAEKGLARLARGGA